MTLTPVRWDGCYDAGWRDLIVPEAFAHPAKMARGLVARIFDELFAMGALERGDLCVDPFGGIGTTAIEGASRGVQVICCELEPKFVDLARKNFALHARDWVAMRRPLPVIVNGDSRQLRKRVGGVVSWLVLHPLPVGPASENNTGTDKPVSAVVGSPPYAAAKAHPSLGHPENDRTGGDILDRCTTGARAGDERYGLTTGQLGDMPEGAVDTVISSPPYAEIASGSGGLNTKPAKDGQQGGRSASTPSQDTDSRYGETEGQLARLPKGDVDAIVSSPPFTQGYSSGGGINKRGYTAPDGSVDAGMGARTYQGTGNERVEGNLETLTLGDVDAVVSSPPFGQDATGHVGANKWKSPEAFLAAGRGNGGSDEARLRQLERDNEKTYGDSDGQLAAMPMGDTVDAVVTSPPYEGSLASSEDGIDWQAAKRANNDHRGQQRPGASVAATYPATDGNVGNATGETFWSAAKEIVEESFAILKPGGVAVWVVKMFVRDKHLVDFPGDWRKLCEHVGFETFLEVHASLVHEEIRSHLFDGEVVKRRERKSFFRRLAEKKGSPRIDFETVLFMRKRA